MPTVAGTRSARPRHHDAGWWLAGTRLGGMILQRMLAIVGTDTDLTPDEIHQVTDGLRRAGFSQPGQTRTAVLVSEGPT